MKKLVGLQALFLAAILSFAASKPASTFEGEIADSSCANNIHSLTRSHREMLKSKSMGNDAASCSRYCIGHMGAHWVLVYKNNVYSLDHPDLAEKFAGQRVTVTGSLDEKANSIAVSDIQALPK